MKVIGENQGVLIGINFCSCSGGPMTLSLILFTLYEEEGTHGIRIGETLLRFPGQSGEEEPAQVDWWKRQLGSK